MASKNWILVTGAFLVLGVLLAFLGVAGNKMLHGEFKKALVATGSGATGASFVIGESDLNIFTGQGFVKNIVVSGVPGESAGSAFELYDVAFEVKPLSLFRETIDVTALTIGELKAAVTVKDGSSGISDILSSARAFSKDTDGDYSKTRLIIRKLNIQKADLKARVMVFGKLVTKSISLPPVSMTEIGGNEGGASPAIIAYDILKEVGSSALNRALSNF